jgi:predicted glycosyltransferase
MRIWIDLANSPHVPFFRTVRAEFIERGHEVEVTARAFAETVELAEAAGLVAKVIGSHGGRELSDKAGNLVQRAGALIRWARGRGFDLAVSHNSYSQILAARALRLKTVTLMDYEYQPANHLAFRLSSRIIVPRVFPQDALVSYGARLRKVRRYDGTKEDVYLAGFEPDPHFADQLNELGVSRDDVLVVLRPPAHEALYHRFENELFDALLERLCAHPAAKVILLPRNASQRAVYAERASEKLILPSGALDGANLIASSDLVVSAGGTMNREAAALGIPAATIYAGKWAAVDEELVRQGCLLRISTREDLRALPLGKKGSANRRQARNVLAEVADLILND